MYLIPSITFTIILALSTGLYLLLVIIQLIKYIRYGSQLSILSSWTLQNVPRIATVAGLIVLERIVYRHAYSFALGLELILLKVELSFTHRLYQAALPLTYLLFTLGNTNGFAALSLPMIGGIATLIALFSAAPVSLQAFIAGIFINFLLVAIILRISSILEDVSIFSFLFQLSVVHHKNQR